MLSREQIESFLDRLTGEVASYQEIEDGLWVVKPGGQGADQAGRLAPWALD